jgi:DNA invertase Pin-like site-specific DNA recombinase
MTVRGQPSGHATASEEPTGRAEGATKGTVSVPSTTRVVLLGRVSTSVQRTDAQGKVVREAQDPENQQQPLREAARRLGWVVADEVVLEGVSAWDANGANEVRRRILEPFEQGRADVLMVWSLDRVVRGGIEEAFRFLTRLERDLGAGFWSLREPFLNTTADREQRELMVALLSWVAKWESERRSQRLKAKAEAKRNQVASGGGRARWGRGSLPSHEDELRIRELVGSGKSVRAVAAETGFSKSTVHRVASSSELGTSVVRRGSK